MKSIDLGIAPFSLRSNEHFVVLNEPPFGERFIAVSFQPISPPGPLVETTPDGYPVEEYAFVCAAWNYEEKAWRWEMLEAHTKVVLGDYLLDLGIERGTWYYVAIRNAPIVDHGPGRDG